MSFVPALQNELVHQLRQSGYIFVPSASTRPLLEAKHVLSDWNEFKRSWDRLPLDGYVADGGRYRRRRYSVYNVTEAGIERQPHQPHYQSRDYNPLHGGIERWFKPVEERISVGPSLQTILRLCQRIFGALAPGTACWHAEVHQFRIEARDNMAGRPTPEGLHRDGVDYVLVLLIQRHNVASGITSIHAPDGHGLGAFTLTEPYDAALLDDTRVLHGVTPIYPIDPKQPAYRDVLVVTLRTEPPTKPKITTRRTE